MKTKLLKIIFPIGCYMFISLSIAQNSVENLLTEQDWNSLFPKRAGTYGTHPQGYTTDFFSYQNFNQAVEEMNDYLVEIRIKPGVWGELSTITKKSTNTTYLYSDVESWWHSNSTPELVIHVDFADFINYDSETNNKRELAAFLANISKETTGGWELPVGSGSNGDYAGWGLYFVHEVGYTSSNSAGVYSQASTEYPPNPTMGYYGRGPIQLSWNYNYGQFSKFLYNDINILLDNPNLVQEDAILAFKSAIWFWMMPQCPKPSCHQVMHNLWFAEPGQYEQDKMNKKGFAHTNNIINGGLECRNSSTTAFTEKVVLRSELYKYYLEVLGFSLADIDQENTGDYTTLCYESSTDTMEDYITCHNDTTLDTPGFSSHEFQVYPNPAITSCTITSNQKQIRKIELFNVQGQKILSDEPNDRQVNIYMQNIPSGLYIVNIISDSFQSTFKLVKK